MTGDWQPPPPADPAEPPEPGRQLERTTLSWNRTLVALAGCAALLIRDGLGQSGALAVVVGGIVLVVALVLALVVHRAYRARGAMTRRPSVFAGAGMPMLVTALVSVMALAGVVLGIRDLL